MAVETYTSVQAADGYRKRPTEEHGKLRIAYFEVTALAVAGDADSIAYLCDLPPGAVRILPGLSRVTSSALGASRTLDIGHAAYQKRDSAVEAFEAVNYEAFCANLDVSSAVAGVAFSTALKYDVYSKTGVQVYARVQGGTWPANATLSGYITYIAE